MIRRVLAAGAAVALGATLTAAAPAAAAPTKKPGPQTITQIAAANPDFTYLVAALEATGLDQVLDANGSQYTVFAPTNEAFERAAKELGFGEDVPKLLDYLVTNDLAKTVLLYHVTEGRRFANSVVGHKTIDTLAGLPLTVSGSSLVDASTATGDAAILTSVSGSGISASNGVIHVIDDVLVPLP